LIPKSIVVRNDILPSAGNSRGSRLSQHNLQCPDVRKIDEFVAPIATTGAAVPFSVHIV
jgi:hypothetical protein